MLRPLFRAVYILYFPIIFHAFRIYLGDKGCACWTSSGALLWSLSFPHLCRICIPFSFAHVHTHTITTAYIGNGIRHIRLNTHNITHPLSRQSHPVVVAFVAPMYIKRCLCLQYLRIQSVCKTIHLRLEPLFVGRASVPVCGPSISTLSVVVPERSGCVFICRTNARINVLKMALVKTIRLIHRYRNGTFARQKTQLHKSIARVFFLAYRHATHSL